MSGTVTARNNPPWILAINSRRLAVAYPAVCRGSPREAGEDARESGDGGVLEAPASGGKIPEHCRDCGIVSEHTADGVNCSRVSVPFLGTRSAIA